MPSNRPIVHPRRAGALGRFFPDRAQVQTRSTTDGGTQTTWTTIAHAVPVLIGPGAPRLATDADGVTRQIVATPLSFPPGTLIPAGGQIAIGARRFLVIGPDGPVSADVEGVRVVQTQEIV